MNVENNQRFQDTEKRILEAYAQIAGHKNLDKITVAEICRTAKIHRTTFYGHFLDVVELQEKVVKKQFLRFWQGFFQKDGNWDFREGMQKQMEFYYRNKETIKVHLENAEKTEGFETFFNLPLDKEFLEEYQTFFHLKNEKEVQYHQEFFNTGMTAAVRRWVLSDCKESPEEMTDLLCRIFRVAF